MKNNKKNINVKKSEVKKAIRAGIGERFKIAWDPEYLLVDNNGRVQNAIHILKRNKENPIMLCGGKAKLYYDNVNCEHTTPISSSKEEAIANMKNVYQEIQNKLGKNYRLFSKAAHKFDKEQLDSEEAWQIGCSPSINIFDQAVIPQQVFNDTVRTTCGHLHASHPCLRDFNTREQAVKLLDVVLGNALNYISTDETSSARRVYYGRAGEFRFNDDRIEIRNPDSFYLRSPETLGLAYDIVDYCMNHILNNTENVILNKVDVKQHREAINTHNRELSKSILEKINLPKDLMEKVCKDYNPDLYRDWQIKV